MSSNEGGRIVTLKEIDLDLLTKDLGGLVHDRARRLKIDYFLCLLATPNVRFTTNLEGGDVVKFLRSLADSIEAQRLPPESFDRRPS